MLQLIFDVPAWLEWGLIGVGLVVARLALSTARTPQGAAAWAVFLVSFPALALPAYAVFGGVSKLRGAAGAPEVEVDADTRRAAREAAGPDRLHAVISEPFVDGNAVDLLVNGEATFDAIHAAIDAAETEVLVQYYILADDRIGRALAARMKAAAARGVRVALLCDLIGCLTLPRRFVRDLRGNGVEVRGFRGREIVWAVRPNFRNHRKAVIVDGRVGFTGGINARLDHVTGADKHLEWRDTFVRFEGPAARQLRAVFAGDWNAYGAPDLPALGPPPPPAGDVRIAVAATGRADGLERGSLLLCGLVGLARRRLWIATPYLVPHDDLLTALQLAALKGVDLRIATPRPLDSYLPWYAARAYFDDIQAAGGRVLEYMPGFMHQKVMLIDDDLASVGTMNLDVRSALLNYEQTALIHDRGFAAEVQAMLEADFARCRDAADHPPTRMVQFLAPVARLFAPVL